MTDAMTGVLRERQAGDGGWGAYPGSASNTECTALGLIALTATQAGAGDELAAAADWLASVQNEDGGWPLTGSPGESTWVTSLAVLALGRRPDAAQSVRRGRAWIVREEAASISWRVRLREFLRGSQVVELDFSLDGWPWASGSFSWVEPTSYALLALKADESLSGRGRDRVREGEALLIDRACPGGGWNYGNKRVLGVDLEPYPDTTALALLALQGAARGAVVETGLDTLERLMDARASGLALALGVLARRAWQSDARPWTDRLVQRFAETGFLGETRPIALAAIALADRAHPFLLGAA